MSHQQPISNVSKPDECPICLCGEDEEELTQFCCGHHVHKKCIIHCGKHKCPVCRQFIYLDKQTLRELRVLAKQKQLETQHPATELMTIAHQNSIHQIIKFHLPGIYFII